MTDDEAFLQVLREAPNDDPAWLVYADWLEERTDPRAGPIRLEPTQRRQLAQLPEPPPPMGWRWPRVLGWAFLGAILGLSLDPANGGIQAIARTGKPAAVAVGTLMVLFSILIGWIALAELGWLLGLLHGLLAGIVAVLLSLVAGVMVGVVGQTAEILVLFIYGGPEHAHLTWGLLGAWVAAVLRLLHEYQRSDKALLPFPSRKASS